MDTPHSFGPVYTPGFGPHQWDKETNHGLCSCGQFITSDQYSWRHNDTMHGRKACEPVKEDADGHATGA